MLGARLWKRAVQLVYMLKQVRVNPLPERVKDNADPLAAGQFSRRHKIAVSGDENDSIRLLFQRNRGYVRPDAHIDSLLLKPRHKISVGQVSGGAPPGKQILLRSLGNNPFPVS